MFKCKFNNVEELKMFLESTKFEEVNFCVDPDYIDAIIGLTDYGKLVYDYEKMIEHLAKIYIENGDCDDPYTDAVEWIEYNADIPYWEIVYTNEEIIENEYFELQQQLQQYPHIIIGLNTHGALLIDTNLINNENMDNINKILSESDIECVLA